MINALLPALIGTWACAPRYHYPKNFDLTVTRVSDRELQINGMSTVPLNGRTSYHTLTYEPDGYYVLDKGLVPYPFRGQLGPDDTILFERPNQDRLFFQLSSRETLRFSYYKTIQLQIAREHHMVDCQRLSR